MGIKEKIGGIAAAALFLVGAAPAANAGNEKAQANQQTKYADEQVLPQMERKRKKTPLGGDFYQKGNKPWFKPTYKQMRKKHTNTKHKSHAAKVKRRKKKNGR